MFVHALLSCLWSGPLPGLGGHLCPRQAPKSVGNVPVRAAGFLGELPNLSRFCLPILAESWKGGSGLPLSSESTLLFISRIPVCCAPDCLEGGEVKEVKSRIRINAVKFPP